MATLERLLRRSVTYNPFSERPYRGAYPIGSARRGFFLTTNTPPGLRLLSPYVLFSPKSHLSLYEDRRLYHPSGFKPAVSKTESYPQIVERRPWRDPGPNYPKVDPRGVPQRLVPSKTDPSGYTYIAEKPNVLEKWKLGFGDPWHVAICLKRKMRQEVMHALGLAGKKGFKKPRFTQYSYVRCF